MPLSNEQKKLLQNNLNLIRADDICLCSYPRSGNTMVRFLIVDILEQNKNSKVTLEKLDISLIPTIEKHAISETKNRDTIIYKTHKFEHIKSRNMIYLLRYPTDVIRSYFRFITKGNLDADLDSFIQKSCKEYVNHIESAVNFRNSKENKQIIFTFEELVQNKEAGIKSILQFAGIPFQKTNINIALKNNDLSKLKEREKNKFLRKNLPAPTHIYGEGKIGLSKEFFTKSQFSFIEDRCLKAYEKIKLLSEQDRQN